MDSYEKQAIQYKEIVVQMHPLYVFYKADPLKPFPVMVETEYFLICSKAHLEVLHLLHNNIQKKYFGCETAYDYRTERKLIEWDKILLPFTNGKS